MCSNCTNFTHVSFAQYLHHLMLCQCVEGNVKSTELSLKVVFYLSPSSALFREQCRFEWLGFDGSNIQRKHGARPKPLKQTFEGKLLYLHIISWVRRTRDITGFLSEPSYAMILTKIAKNFSISLYWLHFRSTSYLFCDGVDESNINILLLSNTWDRVPFSQNRDLKNMFSQKREGSMIFVLIVGKNFKEFLL